MCPATDPLRPLSSLAGGATDDPLCGLMAMMIKIQGNRPILGLNLHNLRFSLIESEPVLKWGIKRLGWAWGTAAR